MERDSLVLWSTIRSCVHLLFSFGPVIAAAVAASQLARDRRPAGAAWMLAGLCLGAVVLDALQLVGPMLLGSMYDSSSTTIVTSSVGCALDLPIVMASGLAFFLLKPGPTTLTTSATGGT
ncbi:MAG: hypothetical protein IT379_08685 [Deltaproteobacteria bacterium]|nr:hypothetical protein [Deltaproteobacteria bacterium]